MFNGFDSNGKLTGKKCRICRHQFEDCEYQSPFGDGAFFTCWYNIENIEKCKLEENENNKED